MYIHKGQYTCICQAKGHEERTGASGTTVLWIGWLSQNLYLLGLFMFRNLYLDWDSYPSFPLLKSQDLREEYHGHTTKGVT